MLRQLGKLRFSKKKKKFSFQTQKLKIRVHNSIMQAIDQKFDNWVFIWGSRKLRFNWGNEKCVEVR